MPHRSSARLRSATGQTAPATAKEAGYAHARYLVQAICCLAGSPSFVADNRDQLQAEGILEGIEAHDTARLFDWMVQALSYQGIGDAIASAYMTRHGSVTWAAIAADLDSKPACPKPHNYWQFHDCGYRKSSATCSEPEHITCCPLPMHELRNGRLNQTAYSLFLFIRDIADRDFVRWIDQQLEAANDPTNPNRLTDLIENLVGPLRHIYGVSDKVLMMTLSGLLLVASKPLWAEVGASMIAIDTLVHNFLHRTGILHRLGAEHPYGETCYRPGSCADIIRTISAQIDARQFNHSFPSCFPRFVQNSIWRYCAQSYGNVCNGNRIDDRNSCQNGYCQLYWRCDRKPLINRQFS